MTVNMKQAVGRQTINHFLHTFMKDYDTEKAADRTMKSKYVPRNIKTQLVSAMSRCDSGDRSAIERVARLGMFIDSSCNELVYYNTVVTAVTRWTLSLYVEPANVKRVFEIIMDDVGRICEDDIQFIIEKYQYLEERDGSGTGANGLAGLLKAKKCRPDTPLIRYYGQSLWFKILRALLRNSVKMFNTDSFGSMFAGLVGQDGQNGGGDGDSDVNGLDEESKAMYDEFRVNRQEWLKSMAKINSEKLQNATAESYTGDRRAARNGRPPRPPPDVSLTAFNVRFDEDEDSEDDSSSDDVSDAETVLEVPTRARYHWPDSNCHGSNETAVAERRRKGDSTVAFENRRLDLGPGTTYVAKVTQEKELRILSDDLRDVLVREKTSKALSTPSGSEALTSTTTVQRVIADRRQRNRNNYSMSTDLALQRIGHVDGRRTRKRKKDNVIRNASPSSLYRTKPLSPLVTVDRIPPLTIDNGCTTLSTLTNNANREGPPTGVFDIDQT